MFTLLRAAAEKRVKREGFKDYSKWTLHDLQDVLPLSDQRCLWQQDLFETTADLVFQLAKQDTPEQELVPQYVWFKRCNEISAVKRISRVWRRYKRKKLSANILHEMGRNVFACAVRRKIDFEEENSSEDTPPLVFGRIYRGSEYYKQQYRNRVLRSQRGAPVFDVDSDDDFLRSGTSKYEASSQITPSTSSRVTPSITACNGMAIC